MRAVFLDTVGLLAIWDEDDQWHAAASNAFDELISEGLPFLTTRFVLLECGNAAARTPYRLEALKIRDLLEGSSGLIAPTDEDWQIAWAAYRRGESDNAGIVDQVSFAVMRRLDITQAFTNDRHFKAAEFVTRF